MKDSFKSQSLVEVNENSIFHRIKKFFRKLFRIKEPFITQDLEKFNYNNNISNKNIENAFIDTLKNIESEETKLLALQKRFDNGEIEEEDLSQKQINDLEELYNKQIAELEKSNYYRKQKLLQYRKSMQSA